MSQLPSPGPVDELEGLDGPLCRSPDPIEHAEHDEDQALGAEWEKRQRIEDSVAALTFTLAMLSP